MKTRFKNSLAACVLGALSVSAQAQVSDDVVKIGVLDDMTSVFADQQGMAWEWDFAMPDLFVHEAGGLVTDMSGRRYVYNKPHPRNGGGLLAAVDPTTHARVLAATRAELGLD